MKKARNKMKRSLSAFLSLVLICTMAGTGMTVFAADAVQYIDENGNTQTVTDYTVVTSSDTTEDTTWESGWYVVNSDVTYAGRISVSGTVNLILVDGCTQTSNNQIIVKNSNNAVLNIYGQSEGTGTLTVKATDNRAGIGGDSGGTCGTVTINGGIINATGGSNGAGIGGGNNGGGGNITINDGQINATGGDYGAGIGGGDEGNGGTINISGGDVTANGGYDAAGIGGGEHGDSGGTVNITGGTVTANGGYYGAGIGGGEHGDGGTINITGGDVTATGGEDGAGIGGGYYSDGGNITISDGNVAATGGYEGAGIGGGYEGSGGTINITGGTITATGGQYGAGIGGGRGSSVNDYMGNGGTINITGGTVTAKGGQYGAGIGGGYSGNGGTITINGGIINATGGQYGAGIGGGYGGTGGNIKISGGTVEATGGGHSAGIGGGENYAHDGSGNYFYSSSGTITIEGGNVTAKGGQYGAGIGGGDYGTNGNITISDGTVEATGGEDAAGIGGGDYGDGGTITINGGTVTASGTTEAAGIGGGRYGNGGKITISSGTINATGSEHGAGIGSGRYGDGGTINISGGTVTANGGQYGAGIGGGYGGAGGNIKISGGTVEATGGGHSAGIGGGENYAHDGSGNYFYSSSGTITIEGGNVKAAGGQYGAGIGGGDYGTNGNITISDGTVTATGGQYASGIGGGDYGDGGNITINDGDVTATGGQAASGIGGGRYGAGGNITISGGTVTASSSNNEDYGAAGIGGGYTGDGGNITINDGDVTATGEYYGAGIGGGRKCSTSGTITINGGTVMATGGSGGAGIGSGDGYDSYDVRGTLYVEGGKVGTILITGGTVTANGGEAANINEDRYRAGSGAGIGSGEFGEAGGTITIDGGDVTATGGSYGAGIGGGRASSTNTSTGRINDITINGGTVTATGGSYGAGIGGGIYGPNGGNITINGGVVTAAGTTEGAGIGGGAGTSTTTTNGGIITINGGFVTATGTWAGAGIGGGNYGSGGTITISGGTVVTGGGNSEGIGKGNGGSSSGSFSTGEDGCAVIYTAAIGDKSNESSWSGIISPSSTTGTATVYGSPVITTDEQIPSGCTAWIEDGKTVTIASDTTFTNNGTIYRDYGSTFTKNGTFTDDNGTTYYEITGDLEFSGDTVKFSDKTYSETEKSIAVTSKNFCRVLMYPDKLLEGAVSPFIMPAEPVKLMAHTLTEINQKAATCTEVGYNTDYWYCPECGRYYSSESAEAETEITQESTFIPALGHDWQTDTEVTNKAWNINGEDTTCTITVSCKRDGCNTELKQTLTLGDGITAATITEPGCTTNGVTTYTASVTFTDADAINNDSKEVGPYTATATESIPATGHDWSNAPVFTWVKTDGGYNCTAKITCASDETHSVASSCTVEKFTTMDGAVYYFATVSLFDPDNGYALIGTYSDFVTANVAVNLTTGVYYISLQDAIDEAENGETIQLLSDVCTDAQIVVAGKTITIDLNDCTIYNEEDLWDNTTQGVNSWSLISVQADENEISGNLTIIDTGINGTGTLLAKENDVYACDVRDGSSLTIEAGTYAGNMHAVYVYEGSATVNGGYFYVQQQYSASDPYGYVLDCDDDAYAAGTASIVVTGGSFVGFNPEDCSAEGENTNLIDSSNYHSLVTGQEDDLDIYTVGRHSYYVQDTEEDIVAPTCEEYGYTIYACECGVEYETDWEEPIGHSYDNGVVTTPATCGEDGVKTYTCQNDTSHQYTEVIPATGNHTWGTEGVVTTPATCEDTGITTYTCTTCGATYEESIAALGHNYSAEQDEVTGEYLYVTFTWDNEDYTKLTDVTCTATFTCTDCGYTEEVICTVEPTENNHVASCTTPDDYDVKATATITNPRDNTEITATEDDILYGVALDHQLDKGEVTKKPTCMVEGVLTKSCTREGCDYTETEPIPVTDHSYYVIYEDEATCTTNGTYYYACKCTDCGENCGCNQNTVVIDGETINYAYKDVIYATDHSIVKVEASDPTCTEDGNYEYYVCTLCGATFADEDGVTPKTQDEIVIEATGHTSVTDPAVAATCEGTGLTEGSHCSVCNEVLVAQEVTETLGHNYGEPVFIWSGYTSCEATIFCQRDDCSKEITGKAVITSVTTAPTCTEPGETVYTATVTFAVDDNDQVATYATPVTYTDTKTENLDPTGHTPLEAVAENTVDPTCTDKGSYESVIYCEVCGEEISRDPVEVEPTGHTPLDAVAENYTEPTCTETGSYDSVIYCETCGEEVSRTPVDIDALGHTPLEAVVENNVDPTCTEKGSYDSVIYCGVCGEEVSLNTITVEALGHTEATDPAVDPTCDETGLTEGSHCSVCGEIIVAQEEVSALGHETEYYPATEATALQSGNVEYWYCKVCDRYYADEACTIELTLEDAVIPALGLVPVEVIDATTGETITVYLDEATGTYYSDENGTYVVLLESIIIPGEETEPVTESATEKDEKDEVEAVYEEIADEDLTEEETEAETEAEVEEEEEPEEVIVNTSSISPQTGTSLVALAAAMSLAAAGVVVVTRKKKKDEE